MIQDRDAYRLEDAGQYMAELLKVVAEVKQVFLDEAKRDLYQEEAEHRIYDLMENFFTYWDLP